MSLQLNLTNISKVPMVTNADVDEISLHPIHSREK